MNDVTEKENRAARLAGRIASRTVSDAWDFMQDRQRDPRTRKGPPWFAIVGALIGAAAFLGLWVVSAVALKGEDGTASA